MSLTQCFSFAAFLAISTFPFRFDHLNNSTRHRTMASGNNKNKAKQPKAVKKVHNRRLNAHVFALGPLTLSNRSPADQPREATEEDEVGQPVVLSVVPGQRAAAGHHRRTPLLRHSTQRRRLREIGRRQILERHRSAAVRRNGMDEVSVDERTWLPVGRTERTYLFE